MPVRRKARTALAIGRRIARDQRRWREILRAEVAPRGEPRVFYGVDHVPSALEPAAGGMVKFQRLAKVFPNAPREFNVVYVGSSTRPDDLRQLLWLARRRGAPVVWNQDGVGSPGWAGRRYQAVNRPLALGLHAAEHVFFQSRFCKLSADRFLGERREPWEILYNAVDTASFAPTPRPRRPPTLLLGGNQYQRYRFETAVRTLAALARDGVDARLVVTGALSWDPGAPADAASLVARLGLDERVELLGPYAQADAPAVLARGDVLLHTKFNDPCPGIVLEAMACGLPVVYSASGGVPELVGNDAGVGLPAPLDFERDHPLDPDALAAAVLRVLERREDYAAAARRRAVERFDLRPWLERHREVFEMLTS